jgi:hypothetical protein
VEVIGGYGVGGGLEGERGKKREVYHEKMRKNVKKRKRD